MALNVQVNLSEKQIGDIVEDGYIDSKIRQCEAFLDDLSPEEDQEIFDTVNNELAEWNSLKTTLETQYLGKK